MLLQTAEARAGAVPGAQRREQLGADDVEPGIVVFGHDDEHRNALAGADVGERRARRIGGGVLPEIGLHVLAVGIGRIVFQPVAPADQDRAAHARSGRGLQAAVKNI